MYERQIGQPTFKNLSVGIRWLRIAENLAVLKKMTRFWGSSFGYHNPGAEVMGTGKLSSSGKLSNRAGQSGGLPVPHHQRRRSGAIKKWCTSADAA